MSLIPPNDLLYWERQLWDGGYRCIAGIDEVGRGALAGPLVAAAVILPVSSKGSFESEAGWLRVRDSKTIAHSRRSETAAWIHASRALVSIAEVSCQEVDSFGLSAANRCAMERAVAGLPIEPDILLIDAMTLDLGIPQIGIIDGDALSLSIAAASIIAKVHRDSLMVDLDSVYPAYGFARHKGYGVRTHLDALVEYGPCPTHRHSFAPVKQASFNGGQH
jgi:ribonuclease HII